LSKVSIIIPGRAEKYFQQTIDTTLENARGDIEIIAIADGPEQEQKCGKLIARDSRVKIIRLEKAIGQRAAYNLGVRKSTGEYVMKIDAHCILSPGFDIELKSYCPEKTTVLPVMKRLNVEKWEAKKSGATKFMYFGLDVFCHYWKAYEKRPQAKEEYPEVLTGQGSCWFMRRDWNDYIGILDESLGSWGKVGIEISLKTWLCGGRQIVNKKAWQAHWFRAGEGRFPYPFNGRKLGKTKEFTFNHMYFAESGAFPNQCRPFSWLMDKFKPVPGWEAYHADQYKANRIILFYNDKVERSLSEATYKNLMTVAGPIPIVSILPSKKQNQIEIFKTILEEAENQPENSIIYICRNDVFYHPSHFAMVPDKDDLMYFNRNKYYWHQSINYFFTGKNKRDLFQSVVKREYLISHCKKQIAAFKRSVNNPWRVRFVSFESERPNVIVKHDANLTVTGDNKREFIDGSHKSEKNIPGWGGVRHFQSQTGYKGTMRYDIIQYLIDLYEYQSYLEIGCNKDDTFKRVNIPLKHGCDPGRGGTHRMTSDEFFKRFKDKYDLIFIDGLHICDQVKKDIDNALKHLNKGGTIVIHDCKPRNYLEQKVPREPGQNIWIGDGWKAFVHFRRFGNLEMYTVDTNNGIGIIRPGKQETLVIRDPKFGDLKRNIDEWLNYEQRKFKDIRDYEPVAEEMMYKAGRTNTICQTLREIYGLIDSDKAKLKCREAMAMAKSIVAALKSHTVEHNHSETDTI
jgi:glycosyltransferase involved in cell wall biosynthesis